LDCWFGVFLWGLRFSVDVWLHFWRIDNLFFLLLLFRQSLFDPLPIV
jgi:hypothetical protein